jgi:hypothetical protein
MSRKRPESLERPREALEKRSRGSWDALEDALERL